MIDKKIDLFVPGRLCLFGEHSDWAGALRIFNSDIWPGEAIVTGINQGIWATVCKSNNLSITLDYHNNERIELEMSYDVLHKIAQEGGFFSYVAGVAAYVVKNYYVSGLDIHITKVTLPIKRGLSSSAAICVLVARAFNLLYNLQLNTKGEMQIAYQGELQTPSRCGHMDQACAYGLQTVYMKFDGNEIETEILFPVKNIYLVYADLNGSKDTMKILADLNMSYPYPQKAIDYSIHKALGKENHKIVSKAKKYLQEGDDKKLGQLMTEAQHLFDTMVAPACIRELKAPIMHKILKDLNINELSYGGKGVGSQGDGTIQLLAKNVKCQKKLVQYLTNTYHLSAIPFTIRPQNLVHKAIIPIAGFGTRMYPITKIYKKELLPVMSADGFLKPAILILLEELTQAGIDEICLVVNNEEDKNLYNKLFKNTLPKEYKEKMSAKDNKYEERMKKIGNVIEYVIQDDHKGLGHAVFQCRKFAGDEAILLALGDIIYKSNVEQSCTSQLIKAYNRIKKPVIAMHTVPLSNVVNYGIMVGDWVDTEKKTLKIRNIVEKPSMHFAEENLKMSIREGSLYLSVLGEYVLTPEVFNVLSEDIQSNRVVNGEIQLTHALDTVSKRKELFGYLVQGDMFDLGMPYTYRNAIIKY